jgi:hypothetical protein
MKSFTIDRSWIVMFKIFCGDRDGELQRTMCQKKLCGAVSLIHQSLHRSARIQSARCSCCWWWLENWTALENLVQ